MKPEVTGVSHVMTGGDYRTVPRLGFPLPESKFHPPGVRPGIVFRTALVEQLAATRTPVITVTAPPGYGKTTLMAQWADRIGSRAAWLSCNDGDNDPVVLLTALGVALDRIGPVDPAIFPALASSGAPITMVPRFVSAVASVQPPVTVLLDHADAVTNRQCLNTIAEFALRLPPGWQLALASRTVVPLPTARLRALGEIVEITADDLAMGPEEAGSLLKEAGAEVDEAGLRDLLQRTEG
jgi:LuxR family maltose regulon positive regulatory protein